MRYKDYNNIKNTIPIKKPDNVSEEQWNKTIEFIQKCQIKHGDKYDYTNTMYTKSSDKILITCLEHGSFYQRAGHHSAGHGCPKCGGSFPLTHDKFLKRARKIHGNKYDYTSTKYISFHKKLNIRCKDHGEFKQSAKDHFEGKGCAKCGLETSKEKQKNTVEYFISKSNKIHNNFYDYSLVEYVNSKTKVNIVCPKHGAFFQTPSNHIYGFGCIECGREVERDGNGFYGVKRAERHKKDWSNIEAVIYLIRLYNEEESFYKVGITTMELVKRMYSIPYNYEIICTKEYNLYSACVEEAKLLEKLIPHKYIPELLFAGSTECFSTDNNTFLNTIQNEVQG